MDTIRMNARTTGRVLFKGKVYDRRNWVFGFGAKDDSKASLGNVVFGVDFFAHYARVDISIGLFGRIVRLGGIPSQPRTWRLTVARG